MASAPVKLSIQDPNGSCTALHVEPGTTVSKILDQDAFRLPAGYRARLVTDTAEVLEIHSKVWEPQA